MIYDIINEDGSSLNIPYSDEYKKLKEKYPQCEYWGYNCMYCYQCMCGEYFEPADYKEAEIIQKHSEEVHKYLMTHNPSMRKLLY